MPRTGNYVYQSGNCRSGRIKVREMATKAFEEACRLFEAGGGGNVHYSAACAGLGQVFYLKGQISEAVHWYEKALALMERDFGRTEYYRALAHCVMKLRGMKL